MKKTLTILTILLIIIIVPLTSIFIYKQHFSKTTQNPPSTPSVEPEENQETNNFSVSYNGWLHTQGASLKNQKNEIIQLQGISSHGIEWFSDVITYDNLKNLKDNWNINIFRIAVYTDSYGRGYIFNSENTLTKVNTIIDMAVELDMYIVVDWHILDDNDPLKYKEQSKVFFNTISSKYANTPNVIYEICNEPNGKDVTWEKNIKPYAEEIIPIIRNNSKDSLIIVGTPEWCTQISIAANNPLNFDNILYSCHFYAGTHNTALRNNIDYCIEKNIPIFVSECGVTKADGNGDLYTESFREWIDYLNSKKISWIRWSFSNKKESSAILLPEYKVVTSNPLDINNYLTDCGKFLKQVFMNQ